MSWYRIHGRRGIEERCPRLSPKGRRSRQDPKPLRSRSAVVQSGLHTMRLVSPSRRLLAHLVPYRIAFLQGLGCVVAASALQLAAPWVTKHAIDDLVAQLTAEKISGYAAGILALAAAGGWFRFQDAPHHRRRVARVRVRAAQRVLRPPAAARPRLLPAHAHRRPDVARHERPQRRAHDDGPGGDVHVEHGPDVRRGGGADGLDRPVAHGRRARAAAVRVALRPLLRQGDSRPVRADPGPALDGERDHAGVAVGRPRGARLPAGAVRARSVSRRQRRIRPPQPRADRPPGDVLPEHGPAHGDRCAAGPVAGQPRGGARPDDDWRAGGVQRLPGDAGVADDRLRLGHQPAAAGPGVVEAAARGVRRGASGVRRRGAGGRATTPRRRFAARSNSGT